MLGNGEEEEEEKNKHFNTLSNNLSLQLEPILRLCLLSA